MKTNKEESAFKQLFGVDRPGTELLVALDRLREQNTELVAALELITDYYANDCKCKLSDGFTCVVHRAVVALAKAQEGGT